MVDRIYEGIATEIPKMKERGDIPEATEVTLVSDQSHYIRNAMSNLLQSGRTGCAAGRGRRVALPAAVPADLDHRRPLIVLAILIGGLGFAFTGQTINVMTLGGIALAIGTVVDAGIVVVENMIRHQTNGQVAA